MTPPHLLVAVVALPTPLHGQSYVTEKVLQALPPTNIDVVVCDISPQRMTRSLVYHVTKALAVLRGCRELIRFASRNPKTLYTVVESGKGIYYNYLVCGLAQVLGYTIFLHHHTAGHTTSTRLTFTLLTRLCPRATHIALTAGMKADLMARYGLPESRIMVCCNACHIPTPTHTTKPASPCVRLGMLSNLTEEKGAIRALETALLAHERGLNITLTLAGPVVEPAVAAAMERARPVLKERLITPGPLYGPAKDAFFRNIDVFVFPSLYPNEAQPLVIYEAQSYGCRVITTTAGYIGDMVGPDDQISHDVPFASAAVQMLQQHQPSPVQTLQTFHKVVKAATEQLTTLKECLVQ